MSGQRVKLEALRVLMTDSHIDALLIPRADEYLGEYLPPHNERLLWATGFTGSAGLAIILAESAALFVDGRYTVQVREQVDTELFEIHHLVEEPPVRWLAATLPANSRVCCDPRLHSLRWYRETRATLEQADIELIANADNLVDRSWQDRPAPRVMPALLLSEEYTGEASVVKRSRLGQEVAAQGADAALIFAPESVSWLLNVRGRDVPKMPVLQSSAILHASGDVTVMVNPGRIPEGFMEHVGQGVTVVVETEAAGVLSQLANRKVLADPAEANAAWQLDLIECGAELIEGTDPVLWAKACKNEVELTGTRRAHLRDAVAGIRFLAWLDEEVAAGNTQDEASLADRLNNLRAEQAGFHDLSFDTISASGPNAAQCHYNHLNGTPRVLQPDSVYLVDSGGQYTDGTTDVTRTVAIGDPGPDVRRMFTLVLKGHIALALARFPRGTTGAQLDALARQFLWREGYDFDHGTGHGVGVFLGVHEGPQRISKQAHQVDLRAGMIVSNEPGYYRDGAFGIRCENLQVVREAPADCGDGGMLEFETLTLMPFDRRLLDLSLLDATEQVWLETYHSRVRDTIGPMLRSRELAWLEQATRPLAE